MKIRARAKKILEPMLSYTSLDNSKFSEDLSKLLLTTDEAIGVYKNTEYDYVLITINGIHIVNGLNCQFVRFESIAKVLIASGNKSEAEFLELKLLDGESVILPIRNGNGKFRDIYEFLRFLDRILQ